MRFYICSNHNKKLLTQTHQVLLFYHSLKTTSLERKVILTGTHNKKTGFFFFVRIAIKLLLRTLTMMNSQRWTHQKRAIQYLNAIALLSLPSLFIYLIKVYLPNDKISNTIMINLGSWKL